MFRKGHLYANTLDYFRNLEAAGQGDPNEGSVYSNKFYSTTADTNNRKISIYNSDDPIQFLPLGHVHIVCFYRLMVEITNEDVNTNRQIHIEPNKIHSEFGSHMVVITDKLEFHRRVKHALDIQVIKNTIVNYRGDKIKYTDDIMHWDCIETVPRSKQLLPAFRKRLEYKYQNEYRWVFEKDILYCDGKPYILDIGDIRDITFHARTSEPLDFEARLTFM